GGRSPRSGSAAGELLEEPRSAALDGVAEEPFEHWTPERPAVVQVHREPAPGAGLGLGRLDLGPQHPGAVLAAVALDPFEDRQPGRLGLGALHPQPLRPGERTEAATE